MKNNVFQFIFVVIVISLIVFAAYTIYGQKEEIEEKPVEEEFQTTNIQNNIRLGIAEYDTLNPIVSQNKYVQEISKIIYEPLIRITPDFKVEGALAKELSKVNNTTYLVKLRENVLWHDGEKLEGADVQFTIDRLKEGRSIYSYNVEKVISVEVIDNLTLKIILSEEVPYFEYNLTFPILASHQYTEGDFWKNNRMATGTGMYKIREIKENEIVLKENEKWWNRTSLYKTATININLYSSVGELYNAFKLGNIDIVNTSNRNYTEYIGTIGYNIKEYRGREWDYLVINTSDPILKYKEVRQAIEHAIDKSNIIASVFGSGYYFSNFPLDFGCYAYPDDDIQSRYNPNLSRQIMSENGWKYSYGNWRKTISGKTIKTSINLVVKNSNGNQVATAEAIKRQLKDSRVYSTDY